MRASLGIWIEAARPKTLWAAVSPVLIGISIAFAREVFHLPSAILAMTGAILIQVGTNFYNDLADFEKGADTSRRQGPRRAVASGLISQSSMRAATAVTFLAAIASGVYLMMRGGLPIVAIGVSSILFGLLYTGGKYSLAYLGIADVFVLVFFGPVAVAGTYFVQALEWPTLVWIAGLAPGLLSVGILLVNNIRDIAEDREAEKRTIVVRLGRAFGIRAYFGCMLLASLMPPVLWLWFDAPATIMISLLATPLFIQAFSRLKSIPSTESEKLNPVLAQTAKNLLVFSILFSIGWLLSA